MSAPTVAEAEAVNFETAFHLDKDVASEDPENTSSSTSSWAAASCSTPTR